ncbi:NAD(P)H-binding protein [Companilactobacillus sp. HBUAS56275]|uniref:NAD(P)H-binding protein n=1 Tax=Candidatus Companilactobacillus pullicola TaxID=2838523 RepID=A0A9D2CP86_9LACO|nr:NAD(P)H-binding protein [Candidatus Companilactobacillus pullicola]
MTKYAILGVTGHFGNNALKELLKIVSPSDVIGIARNLDKAQKMVPKGIEIRPGDYEHPEDLPESLVGVDRLLFVSSRATPTMSRVDQHSSIIRAAIEGGVKYIAYTSFPHSDTSKSVLASDHRETEREIIDAGFDYSFLRNNFYLEDELPRLKAADEGKPFVHAAGYGRVGWALENEYSEAAAKVLAMDNPKKVYEFAGPALTYGELAESMNGDFELSETDLETYRDYLEDQDLSEPLIRIALLNQQAILEGQLDEETSDLPIVLGHNLMPIEEAIKIVLRNK